MTVQNGWDILGVLWEVVAIPLDTSEYCEHSVGYRG